MNVRCVFCSCELRPDSPGVYRKTVGWEHKAMSGSRRGGSDIVLREPVGEFACAACIDAQKHGRSPHQEALI